MLQRLHIKNYAIIAEIEINFSPGLNIITGETGAGKSILMGALDLVLGQRADTTVLMDKKQKAVVEALFNKGYSSEANKFLKINDLDTSPELLIRREITPNGKSRAFINDTPVNLNQLKELSSLLVDLHQQFDTLELGNIDFQRASLDAMANNGILLTEYSKVFHHYTNAKKELEELTLKQAGANKEQDYHLYLFEELEEAGFKENELEELDTELKMLNNAENIKQLLSNICFELKEAEQPIVQQLKVLSNKLYPLYEFHKAIPELGKRILGAQAELADIAGELSTINESVQYSPERIQQINDKIAMGYKLLKKHHATSTSELLVIKDGLQNKLDDILNITDTIEHKQKETNELVQKATQLATKLSANRKKAVKPFADNVNALLIQVGMPNASISIQMENTGLNYYGHDNIEFLFDANKSNRYEPLRKVASGGELSRLMLCIKSLVAKKLQLPTLIFDEIDTGISGEAARQVGMIMKDLSGLHQLISITHQAQIAAKADAHYFVYKSIQQDAIVTFIRLLDNDERITTIAKMLSGEKPSPAALENAREMVGN